MHHIREINIKVRPQKCENYKFFCYELTFEKYIKIVYNATRLSNKHSTYTTVYCKSHTISLSTRK